MQQKKVDVSIIIIHYRANKELFNCVSSIIKSKQNASFEILVVDNDEKKIIEEKLKEKFPQTQYIKNQGNLGFGAGNNFGATKAHGEFLFFLNPDTIVLPHTIDLLYKFMIQQKGIGLVAPLLLDSKGKPYPLQGSGELTPLVGLFVFSFIDKFFPNNIIYRNYYVLDKSKKKDLEVSVVPGTAIFISARLFEKLGGFDENFFLYFEESDLCRRVKQLGYKVFIHPKAKVVHLWGRSTQDQTLAKKVFVKSRFYYFKKHFGLFWAIVVHIIASIGNPFKH